MLNSANSHCDIIPFLKSHTVAYAERNRNMSAHKKRLAIIGLGGQTQSELIPALLRLEKQCEITALCDLNQEFISQCKDLLHPTHSVHSFSDYKKLFTAVDSGELELNGVILSVPHFLYAEITELAVARGIAVFKEKPFALNLEEAKKLGSLALKEGVQIYTVTKRQFYPSYAMGLQLLQDGVIGNPYMYSARHFIPHGNLYEGWRSSVQAAGGGALIDMGYHLLDVILRYFGSVSQANLHWSNTAKKDYTYEVEDAASLHNWHPAGVHGVFQLAVLSGPKEESIEIRGTKGRMIVTKQDVSVYDIYGKGSDHYAFSTDSVEAVATALEDFLKNDKSIWSQNLAHNTNIMRVIDMAYKGRFS